MTEGFPKRLRLRRRGEFLRVQRGGRRIGSPSFLVYARSNRKRVTRLGVTTSRKVGNAVRRNRWKRLLREAFRRNADRRPRGLDVVFVVRPDRPSPTLPQVTQELLNVYRQLQASPAEGGGRRGGRPRRSNTQNQRRRRSP